jgi:outer membrane lipoprotein-sorting protein
MTIAVLLLLPGALWAITGAEVAEKVMNRPTGDTTHSLVKMVLVESDGSEKERMVEQWSGETEGGLSRSVIVFHEPASVKNTRFLMKERAEGGDDQWIYLPGLGRVRRIAASEGDSSFMGTDFTYNDMETRDVAEDRHTILREERLGGYDCYVMESVPKDPSSSQYSRRIQWIAKDIWIPVKAELYDKDGKLLKVMRSERIEKVQGYHTVINTTMENVQTGHATELNIQKLRYNEQLPDGLFTVHFLETGRP